MSRPHRPATIAAARNAISISRIIKLDYGQIASIEAGGLSRASGSREPFPKRIKLPHDDVTVAAK